jgi:hypothetical protein
MCAVAGRQPQCDAFQLLPLLLCPLLQDLHPQPGEIIKDVFQRLIAIPVVKTGQTHGQLSGCCPSRAASVFFRAQGHAVTGQIHYGTPAAIERRSRSACVVSSRLHA